MSNLEKYYVNHNNAFKFPWSLYHKPLLNDLLSFLESYLDKKKEARVLVIGPGSLDEFEYLKDKNCIIDIMDIDPRVISDLNTKYKGGLNESFLVDDHFNNYPQTKYDVIFAKEVIEHIVEYKKFLDKVKGILKKDGGVWMSTPNYGDFILPFIESTVLEVIARYNGFKRKDIHPVKFSEKTLEEAFFNAGFKIRKITKMPYKFSLSIWGEI